MGVSENGDRRLIVAADDDEDILALVAFRLKREGHEVLTARDGEEALALILERSPDLVILDVRMPKMTGIDVVHALRQAEATRAVPVILLTASVQEESVKSGFEAGADEYVKKPFSPHDLVTRVEEMLAAAARGALTTRILR
jgi:DNA-binding response OmpR family regulator